MRKIKRLSMAMAALMMTTAMAFPAMASTEEIDSISLSITSEIYAEYGDSYVEAEVDTDGCYMDEDDVSFTNEPSSGEWDEGDIPKIKVIVHAEDDYKFASGFDKEDVYIDGDGEVTSISRSTKKLTIKITLPEVEYDEDYYEDSEDLELDDVEWDEDEWMAYWDKKRAAVR